MYRIETDTGQEFHCPQTWTEMTIDQFIRLARIPIPAKLEELWRSAGNEAKWHKAEESITDQEHIKEHPEYFGRAMAVITTLDQETIERIDWRLRTDFYYEYIHPFVLSIIYEGPVFKDKDGSLKPYKPEPIKEFTYKDERYTIPKSIRVLNEEIPLGNEPIVTFAEAADIELAFKGMAQDGAEKLALVLAIYARKTGEKYNSKEALKRSRQFKDLDMETAWSVFFYIAGLFSEYRNDTLKFLRDPATQKLKQQAGPPISKVTILEG